jgi:death on curing protein
MTLSIWASYRDDNKRIAFLAMYGFLDLNGRKLEAPEDEVARIILAVAAGWCSEGRLAEWVRGYLVPLSQV